MKKNLCGLLAVQLNHYVPDVVQDVISKYLMETTEENTNITQNHTHTYFSRDWFKAKNQKDNCVPLWASKQTHSAQMLLLSAYCAPKISFILHYTSYWNNICQRVERTMESNSHESSQFCHFEIDPLPGSWVRANTDPQDSVWIHSYICAETYGPPCLWLRPWDSLLCYFVLWELYTRGYFLLLCLC